MLVYAHNEKLRKIVESNIISKYGDRIFFYCVSLFCQIAAEKFKNPLSEIIRQ